MLRIIRCSNCGDIAFCTTCARKNYELEQEALRTHSSIMGVDEDPFTPPEGLMALHDALTGSEGPMGDNQ